ncbi:MAG: DNA polymerase II large subunit [Candidatus Nanoarchaeia archaeon]
MQTICSESIKHYFEQLTQSIQKEYSLASEARLQNYDPATIVEIALAKNMAQKVEALVSSVAPNLKGSGLAEEIENLEKKYSPGDWRIALEIAKSVATEKFCKFKDLKEAIEVGIRTGFAYITLGSVSAPLEGFTGLKFKKRLDGKDYLALYFSGPIRGAGGTAISVCILIADFLRKHFKIPEYDITPEEIKRYQVELDDYMTKVAHRQYKPSPEEIAFLVKNIKLEITGDPTEIFEVSQCKRLPRVETDNIRGGMALVLTEGPPLKAEKVWKQLQKWGKDFGFEDWNWLKDFIELKTKLHSAKLEEGVLIKPIDTYLSDTVAGRPILSYPSRIGGFRLRYGRSRFSGLAATGIHPATMAVLKDYVAIGTQIKMERPGKATVFTPCDSIEGPIVKLKDGSVVKPKSYEEAKRICSQIEKILYLGDILISYGDFSEAGQRLAPAGYCEEWWEKEVEKITNEQPPTFNNAKEAFEFACKTKTPLHPKYTYFWKNITKTEFNLFKQWIEKLNENTLPYEDEPKRILEILGIPHFVKENLVCLNENDSFILSTLLKNKPDVEGNSGLDCINKISPVLIRDLAGTFIGARMGRPEKAKLRALTGSPNILFPVGVEGGKYRSLNEAFSKGKITADWPFYVCTKCAKDVIYPKCIFCGSKAELRTKKQFDKQVNYIKKSLEIEPYIKNALQKLNLPVLPPLIKGVKNTWNKNHLVEHLVKGILRAKWKLTVNKDGTIRYDMTQLPCTHFKPKEIGTSITKLKELGYEKDINQDPLVNEEQILELKPQDVILPSCPKSPDEPADIVLVRACNFVDDLLEYLYSLPRYYNVKTKDDLIGKLVIGLAPHTSCGIVGRIIGFSEAQGIFAHPYWHAATRRNCDGDEVCIMLALEAFLNFSRNYLPDRIGARNMDAPLVLTTQLIPQEVDTEVHGMDIVEEYPLEFYLATLDAKYPWEIKISQVKDLLGKPEQYENLKYTHDVLNVNNGALCSSYKTIPTMLEKLAGQLDLANKIYAVDVEKVAELVIDKHFLRDIKGNLRKFTNQELRCVSCNAKYRRPPMSGVCTICNGKLVFTIAEGTIKKYLEAAIKLSQISGVPAYMQQTLNLLKQRIDSIFGKEATKQIELDNWFK